MKELNQEHIKALMSLINKSSYFQLLSMTVTKLDMGYCRLELKLDKKHQNPFGVLHGGVYASVIDTAAFWACYCEMPENTGFVSIDLSVNNIATAKDEGLIVEGKTLKMGRSICIGEAIVRDEKGKLLAQGISKQMVTGDLQAIDQAIQAMGYSTLPPKFL